MRPLKLALCVAIAPAVFAQTPPTAYTVTQTNAMYQGSATITIMRDGSKAMIDQDNSRQYYDLDSHQTWGINKKDPSAGCSTGRWGGDWGDPFVSDDVDKAHPKSAGSEAVNGMPATVYTADGGIKVWRDPKTGLFLKVNVGDQTFIETKSFRPGKPSVSLTPPAACLSQKLAPTDAEKIAAETGDTASNYDKGNGPATPASCSVLFRAVAAGTMQPVNIAQAAIDTVSAAGSAPHYTYGVGTDGHLTFSGAGLHEVTQQLRNGALRIDNAPDYFEIDTAFGAAGSANAGVYRHCAGPQTVLLMIIEKPAKVSDGFIDYLWVKSGPYSK